MVSCTLKRAKFKVSIASLSLFFSNFPLYSLFDDIEIVVDVVVVQNKIVFVDLVESLDLGPGQLGEVEVGLGCRVPPPSHRVDPGHGGQGQLQVFYELLHLVSGTEQNIIIILSNSSKIKLLIESFRFVQLV